jgi:hypothetical protein
VGEAIGRRPRGGHEYVGRLRRGAEDRGEAYDAVKGAYDAVSDTRARPTTRSAARRRAYDTVTGWFE